MTDGRSGEGNTLEGVDAIDDFRIETLKLSIRSVDDGGKFCLLFLLRSCRRFLSRSHCEEGDKRKKKKDTKETVVNVHFVCFHLESFGFEKTKKIIKIKTLFDET